MPGPVVVVEYNEAWPAVFAALVDRVMAALGRLASTVEHVGSTSVPGLAAKPVIDMDVVVASSTDMPVVIESLATLGYVHRGDLGIKGREAFESPADTPDHHLYACAANSAELRRHLLFRDYLRAHPEVAAEYGRLKQGLAQLYGDDRVAYTEAKTAFVQGVLRSATGDA